MKLGSRRPEKIKAETEIYLPEIQYRRRRRRRQLAAATIFFLIYLGLLFLGKIVLETDFLRLRRLDIKGADRTPPEEIMTLLRHGVMDAKWKHFLGFDNILVWPKSLSSSTLVYLPQLKDLKIERDYRRRAVGVEIVERTPFGIWCRFGGDEMRCLWFDGEGVVLGAAPAAAGILIPVVNDYTADGEERKRNVLPPEEFANLISVIRVLEAAKIKVKEIRLENLKLAEVKVPTYDGPELYFSLRFSATNTLPILNSFQQAAGSEGIEWDGLKYIDFRVENRAYYR